MNWIRYARSTGPARYSEHAEEWIIRDFFRDQRDGFFVDIGANDYRRFSNTFYLEEKLGWSGIAIEPQRRFEADYKNTASALASSPYSSPTYRTMLPRSTSTTVMTS